MRWKASPIAMIRIYEAPTHVHRTYRRATRSSLLPSTQCNNRGTKPCPNWGIRTIYGIEDEGRVLKVRGGDFANLHQPRDESAAALAP